MQNKPKREPKKSKVVDKTLTSSSTESISTRNRQQLQKIFKK